MICLAYENIFRLFVFFLHFLWNNFKKEQFK